MVEVDEIGQVVDPGPVEWHPRAPALANRFKVWTVHKELGVAVHADLGRWNVGRVGRLHRGVAITAVQAESADMMGVAEGDRLLARLLGASGVKRAVQFGKCPGDKCQDEHCAEDRNARKRVRAVMKYLGHRLLPLSQFQSQKCVSSHQEDSKYKPTTLYFPLKLPGIRYRLSDAENEILLHCKRSGRRFTRVSLESTLKSTRQEASRAMLAVEL